MLIFFEVQAIRRPQQAEDGKSHDGGDRGSDDAKRRRRRFGRHRRRRCCWLPSRSRGQGLAPRRGEREREEFLFSLCARRRSESEPEFKKGRAKRLAFFPLTTTPCLDLLLFSVFFFLLNTHKQSLKGIEWPAEPPFSREDFTRYDE